MTFGLIHTHGVSRVIMEGAQERNALMFADSRLQIHFLIGHRLRKFDTPKLIDRSLLILFAVYLSICCHANVKPPHGVILR